MRLRTNSQSLGSNRPSGGMGRRTGFKILSHHSAAVPSICRERETPGKAGLPAIGRRGSDSCLTAVRATTRATLLPTDRSSPASDGAASLSTRAPRPVPRRTRAAVQPQQRPRANGSGHHAPDDDRQDRKARRRHTAQRRAVAGFTAGSTTAGSTTTGKATTGKATAGRRRRPGRHGRRRRPGRRPAARQRGWDPPARRLSDRTPAPNQPQRAPCTRLFQPTFRTSGVRFL